MEPRWKDRGARRHPPDAIAPVGYNGDPDRTGDREANLLAASSGKLWTVDAPTTPDQQLVEQAGSDGRGADRAQHNGDAFDQLWNRTAALYYSAPDAAARRAQWETLKTKYRPRAVAAKNDDELKTVMHEMLREHPPYRQAATVAPRYRARIRLRRPRASKCCRRAATSSMRRWRSRSRSASSSPMRAVRAATDKCSSYQKGMDRPQLIEFMSRVPEDAGLGNTALLQNGRFPDGGPAVVNVPGTVAAMYLAWQKFGSKKLAWSDLLQPAIRAARDGYVVSEGLRDDTGDGARAIPEVRIEPRAVLPRRSAAPRRRHVEESRSRVDARADRQGRRRRVLQG